jgi:outer membrane protein insertion porin family
VDGISRGFNLSYRATDFDDLDTADYKIDTGIIGVNYGIPLSESNRFRFGFDLRHIDFETGSAPSQEVLDFESAEGNKFLNFETTISWREDSRDSAIFPKRGATQSLSA